MRGGSTACEHMAIESTAVAHDNVDHEDAGKLFHPPFLPLRTNRRQLHCRQKGQILALTTQGALPEHSSLLADFTAESRRNLRLPWLIQVLAAMP